MAGGWQIFFQGGGGGGGGLIPWMKPCTRAHARAHIRFRKETCVNILPITFCMNIKFYLSGSFRFVNLVNKIKYK